MHPLPSNILRSSVIGSVAKYEHTKNGVKEEFFSEIDVFRKVKGHICYISYVRQQKTEKKVDH